MSEQVTHVSAPPEHQHVWELVEVDDNDGPARNQLACECGEDQPG